MSNIVNYLELSSAAGVDNGPALRRTVETFIAGGTITAGDIVMWDVSAGTGSGGSGAMTTVLRSALRALGQSLACGVSLESVTVGDKVQVVTSGFAVVNCAADTGTIVVGDPIVASVVTAGEAEVRVAADTARAFGVALEAADATLANFVNICVYPQF